MIGKTKLMNLFINFIDNFDKYVITGNPNFSVEFDKFIGILIFIGVGSKLGDSSMDLFKRILIFIQRMIQSQGFKKVGIYTASSR